MKGILQQTADGWQVLWTSPLEYREPQQAIPLHPDSASELSERDSGSECQFRIVKQFHSDKTVQVAMLTRPVSDRKAIRTAALNAAIERHGNDTIWESDRMKYMEGFLDGIEWYQNEIKKSKQ
jgi:hypothetical protein